MWFRSSAVNPNPEPPNPPFGGLHHEQFKNEECIKKVKTFRKQREITIETYKNAIEKFKEQEDNKTLCEKILKLNMLELRAALQERKYTAVTVAYAYIERAIQIDERLNCITEMIDDIINTAKSMDEKANGCTNLAEEYPLYGLPFSIKSNFHVAKHAPTVGLSKNIGNIKADNCELIKFLKDKGAIPICLTNVPQGLLAYVTSNPLYGTTKNPWDLSRTPGGSSGGEAALVAAGGVAFGVGNDLVGSLRIPAAFCGIVSLKPSSSSISEEGMVSGPDAVAYRSNERRIGLSSGFFTKTVQEQQFLLNITLPEFRQRNQEDDQAGLQPQQVQRETSFIENTRQVKDTLRIAYLENCGFHPVVPSNQRAVSETIKNLDDKLNNPEKRCEFIEFKWRTLGGFWCSSAVAQALFINVMPDNGEAMYQMYKDEPEDKNIREFVNLLRLKTWCNSVLFKLFFWLVYVIGGFIGMFISNGFGVLLRSFAICFINNNSRTDKLRQEFEEYWRDNRIDVLICPAFITPAQPFQYPAALAVGTFITGLFNMLDVTAGVVPVFPVRENENESFWRWWNWLRYSQKAASTNSEELPNAVQVVTLKGEEMECLEVMQLIQDATEGVLELRWKNRQVPAGFDRKSGIKQSHHLFDRVDLHRTPLPVATPAVNAPSASAQPNPNHPSTSRQENNDENAQSTSNQNYDDESAPSTSNQHARDVNAPSTSSDTDSLENVVTHL